MSQWIFNHTKWNFSSLWRAFVVLALDAVCIFISFFLALWVRFDFRFSIIDPYYISNYLRIIGPWILICVVVFFLMGLYNCIWSYVGLREFRTMLGAYAILTVIGLALVWMVELSMPRSFYCLGMVFSFCSTTAMRFSYRFVGELRIAYQRNHSIGKQDKIMIVGAGAAGRSLLDEFAASSWVHDKVVCLIDDNPKKWGQLLEGVRIVGGRNEIPEAARRYGVTRIIFAIPTCPSQAKKEILNICSTTKLPIQQVPGIYQLVNGEVSVSKLKKVEVQDLLGRDPIRVNLDEIAGYLGGKTVMVTGGGGSIGSELCRQIARQNPKELIIFDIYENNAYEIQMELQRSYPELHLTVLIGSVRNTARVNDILALYRPEIVFHAAAHKHVPLMEDSPNEAIKNNVFGTYKMAKAAAKYGVKKFVLISTDKAVNPTNIMGASKRLCEMVVQMMNRQTATEFAAVRFGNVLGSNGSVIPLFEKQIAAGGPVTVTHPEITRFFMTIPEAVSLVLQAGCYARGGEIFVLDMGSPVKIDDMARNLIRLSGYEPDVDIKIEYTGLRPGEKLYEELLMKEEGLRATSNNMIHIGRPIDMDDAAFCHQLDMLQEACKAENPDIKQIVARMVPTYHPGAVKV